MHEGRRRPLIILVVLANPLLLDKAGTAQPPKTRSRSKPNPLRAPAGMLVPATALAVHEYSSKYSANAHSMVAAQKQQLCIRAIKFKQWCFNRIKDLNPVLPGGTSRSTGGQLLPDPVKRGFMAKVEVEACGERCICRQKKKKRGEISPPQNREY